MITWPSKDPDEVLNYTWQPGNDSGDAIASYTATVATGTVAIESDSKTDTSVTVVLSGGTSGEAAALTLRATTDAGLVFEETALIAIVASDAGFSSSFQAIFPAFASASREAIAYWKARAERVITDAFGDDQQHATMLLTAHYLVMQGLGSQADSQRWANFAGASRVKSGSLELAWDSSVKSTGSRYGDEVYGLILNYLGGPTVTGTGTFPVAVNYGGLY
ncbi:DUF4054 domain-containing protein [Novosphingobium pentaromativorans]|uniref:Uncharacterized protein n=1 Tax=Novosphingobium pentaromativorans US6-1 TaxID=1088721 RepID=G6E7J8_9SPHN|nr:DUF4054 domain-containing protein [Novosphingobium pentaromativorans]EHJ62821.1 hypothetical protein NSU_0333 [Novosphingobium pentaromativorans US6-1]